MRKTVQVVIDKTEIAVAGRLLRTASLRHEWFEFLSDPSTMVELLRRPKPIADLFTFLQETPNGCHGSKFYKEIARASVLTVTTFKKWWDNLDFKVRNKIRKAQKRGVKLCSVTLDDDFVRGVEAIYNETPLRQGRKFWHYGKDFAEIKQDLSSFPDRTFFVGAYYENELIGFMKLYQGDNILRTVHIISKLSHRDKPVQNVLIAKAAEICESKGITQLHYGDWSSGGLGLFKVKHGFERVDLPRYFIPLTLRGELTLKLKLHRQLKEYLPERWIASLTAVRTGWNTLKHGAAK